ncbi:hypothetical protein P7C70_g5254, partial [Phenoliferia sp. Uapishka_3]
MQLFRPRPLLRRPRLSTPKPNLSLPRHTTFTSLSRNQLRPLSPATRILLHPGTFLVHLSALTVGSVLVPTIAASNYSTTPTSFDSNQSLSNASERADSDPAARQKTQETDANSNTAVSITTSDPIPNPRQLYSLAALLYKQILKSPANAIFNLRQLHMLRRPILDVPASEVLVPERWIWSQPATATVQAYLETDKEGKEQLLPIVTKLAENAILWDQMVWAKVCEREGYDSTEVIESIARTTNGLPSGLHEEVRDLIRPTAVADTSPPQLNHPVPLSQPHPEPIPSDSGPLASLPFENLQPLITALLRTTTNEPHNVKRLSDGLALAYAFESFPAPSHLETSDHTRISALYRRVISVATRSARIDLAARSWARWVAMPPGRNPRDRSRVQAFDNIWLGIAPNGALRESRKQEFRMRPMVALDTLIEVLASEWAKRGLSPPTSALLIRLVELPLPISPRIEGNAPGQWRRQHAIAYARTRQVVTRIIQDLVGRQLILRSSNAVSIGSEEEGFMTMTVRIGRETPELKAASMEKAKGMTTSDYNALISYSLTHLGSPTLARHLLESLLDAGLQPTSLTSNTLLPLEDGAQAMFAQVDRLGENSHTLPILLNALTTEKDLAFLPRLTFAILPELDQSTSSHFTSTSAAPRTPSQILSDFTAPYLSRPEPIPGRSPYLYVTLLHALARAGKTGLAERVFRHARWAAVRSRSPESTEKPWILPPHAFSIMLNLYALESRRGADHLSRMDSRRWARGWGRNAIRVATVQRRQAELRSKLGSDVQLRGRRSTEGQPIPNTLRQDAARVAVRWDLENGSEPEELRSLHIAMTSFHAKEAMKVVFPYGAEGGRRRIDRNVQNWRRSRVRESASVEKRVWSRRRIQASLAAKALEGIREAEAKEEEQRRRSATVAN